MSAGKVPVVIAYGRWDVAPWLARFRAADTARQFLVYEGPDQPLPERYYLTCWKPDPDIFRRRPVPLLISSPGAGVDHIMKASPPAGVPVIRIIDPDLTGRMVEYVVLQALFHLRQSCAYLGSQRNRRWEQRYQPACREVTVGILGFGEMGQAAAAGLRAIGFRVAGWSRSVRAVEGVTAFHGRDGLAGFLAATDILVNLLPSTPDTRGLIDRTVFAALNRSGPLGAPCFINAGRGDAVKEADLVAALASGVLASASLDVFQDEPLPPQSPFWGMDNVIVTPHVAADSMPDAVVACIMAEIARFEAGQPLTCRVDPGRGY